MDSKPPASSDAPARLGLDYFNHPPTWARNLVAVLAGLLAFYGSIAAAVVGLGEEPKVREPAGEAVGHSAAAPTVPTTATSTKFFAEDSKFRVSFPAQPERSTEQVDEPPLSLVVTTYVVEHLGEAYVVATFPFSAALPFDFDGAAAGSAAEVGGRVDSKDSKTFQGHPAMEIVVTGDGMVMRQLMVRAPDRVVQLVHLSEATDAPQYAAFRDSLEIV